MWEGGTRGTGFLWSPLLKTYGYTSDILMHATDWLPTLLGAINGTYNPPHKLDGVDLWSHLSERKVDSGRDEVLINIDTADKNKISAIRKGDMKLLRGVSNKWAGWYPTPQSKNIKSGAIKFEHQVDKRQNIFSDPVLQFKPSKTDIDAAYERKANHMKSILRSIGRDTSRMNSDPLVITCPGQPTNATSSCNEKKLCLFNVADDPCEYFNLADSQPDTVKELLKRLDYYESTSVKPRNKPVDPKSYPKYHGGAWLPWLNDTEPEE